MRAYSEETAGDLRPRRRQWRARQRDSLGRMALAIGLVTLAMALVAYPFTHFVP